jgi:hypothetical protein
VFGGEIVKRLEHQMHKQRFAMNQPSSDAGGRNCRLFRWWTRDILSGFGTYNWWLLDFCGTTGLLPA